MWLLLCLALLSDDQPEALKAPRDYGGYLHGSITLKDDTVKTGVIRWGKDEAYWDDHFNASKEETPYQKYLPKDAKQKKKGGLKFFGVTFNFNSVGTGRQYIARFGDIAVITPEGQGKALITMKNGKKYGVRGSGDLDETLVLSNASGNQEIEWDQIKEIRFSNNSQDLGPRLKRMYGVVETTQGKFEGFVAWDREERRADDILDGEEGEIDREIPFGDIRIMEKLSKQETKVILRDGTTRILSGTNDVNRDNRGIEVNDARFGRVIVPWRHFLKVRYQDVNHVGDNYDSFHKTSLLHGKVYGKDGKIYMGRIVYDLDESERWEMLDGEIKGIRYSIPFGFVDKMIPLSKKRTRVTLTTGETLVFRKTVDVNADNGGLLIYEYNPNPPVYLTFKDMKKVVFNNLGE